MIKRLLFTLFLMLIFHPENFSQVRDSSKVNRSGLFVGLSAGVGQSEVNNEGILSVANLKSGKKSNISGTLEIGYFISDYIGFSSGINFSSYLGQTTQSTYQNKFTTTDSEKESYERRVNGINITENQNIGLLGIPVCIHFRVPFSKRTGIFLQTGLNFSLPLVKKYQSNGIFTYKGYYPSYNVILENLPAYGFPTNANVATDGTLELKSLCLNGIVTAGFDFKIQQKMQIIFAVFYDKSLSTIASATHPESFQLSSEASEINSMIGGSNQTLLQSTGLKISVRYFLFK